MFWRWGAPLALALGVYATALGFAPGWPLLLVQVLVAAVVLAAGPGGAWRAGVALFIAAPLLLSLRVVEASRFAADAPLLASAVWALAAAAVVWRAVGGWIEGRVASGSQSAKADSGASGSSAAPVQSGPEPPSEERRLLGAAVAVAWALTVLGEGAGFVGFGLVALALLHTLRGTRGRRQVVAGPFGRALAAALALYLGAAMVAWLFGGEGLLRARELGRLGPWLALPLYYVAGRQVSSAARGQAASVFVLTLTAASVLGLVLYVGGLGPEDWPVRDLLRVSARWQLRVPADPERLAVGGFYLHRLKMAHVLVVGIALLVGRQLFAAMAARRRAGELALLGVLLVAQAFTFARAALLALFIAGLLAAWFAAPRLRGLALTAVLSMVVAVGASPHLRARLAALGSAQAGDERAAMWSQAAVLVHGHPFGAGLGNLPVLLPERYRVVAPELRLPKTQAHSLVWSAWAEAGPVGLVGLALLWLLPVGEGLRRLRRRSAPALATAGALFIGAVCFWLIGVGHDVLYHPAVAQVFFAALGLGAAELDASPD